MSGFIAQPCWPSSDRLFCCQAGHLEDQVLFHAQAKLEVSTGQWLGERLNPIKMRFQCCHVVRHPKPIEVISSAHALAGPDGVPGDWYGKVCRKRVAVVRLDGPLGLVVYPAFAMGGLEAARVAQQARAANIRMNKLADRAGAAAHALGGTGACITARLAIRTDARDAHNEAVAKGYGVGGHR